MGFPDDSRDVWGEPAAVDARGEDVESLAYSPDELPRSELPGPVASWSCPAAAKKSDTTWCQIQSLAVGPKAFSTLLVIAHGEVQP